MSPTRRQLLTAVAPATIVLSGCLGDGDPDEEPTPTPTQTPTPSPDPVVQTADHPDHGSILVDEAGMVLYMFDADEPGAGESACYDDCAANWPPLIVEETPTAGEGMDASLTTFERDDGSLQVAADGWPLYYFVGDDAPNEAAGQGVNDVWWVLAPDGSPIRDEPVPPEATVQISSHPDLGDILVGPDEMTLYMFDVDDQGTGESACYDDCAASWPPLIVEEDPTAGEGVATELTTFERDDGSLQVAADGWPLYYFIGDEDPGDVAGQGVNDVWWVLDSSGAPVRDDSEPPEATIQVATHPDLGEILVGPDEMTLYMFDSDEQGADESACYGDCAESWPPLTTDTEPVAGDDVTAPLDAFPRQDDTQQVTADGWPLYYFIGDDEPGDADGQGVNDIWWVLRPDGAVVRDDDNDDPGY